MFRLVACWALCALFWGCSGSVDDHATEARSPATASSPEQTSVPDESEHLPAADDQESPGTQPPLPAFLREVESKRDSTSLDDLQRRYVEGKVRFQTKLCSLLITEFPEFAAISEIDRNRQIARILRGEMREQYLRANDPDRIDTSPDSLLRAYSWTDRDEAALRLQSSRYVELQDKIDELKKKFDSHPLKEKAREQFQQFQNSGGMKELLEENQRVFEALAEEIKAGKPTADSTSSGSVTGTAVDGEGKGVEETEISIYRPNEEEPIAVTTTGDDGRFTLEAVPVGENLVVRAVKPKSLFGVSGEKQSVSVKAGEQTDIGNIELMISVTSE